MAEGFSQSFPMATKKRALVSEQDLLSQQMFLSFQQGCSYQPTGYLSF